MGLTSTLALAWITAIGSILGPAVGVFVALKVREVHLTMNSRLDRLIATEKKASFAEGQSDIRDADPKPAAVAAAQVLATAAETAAGVVAAAKTGP